MLSYSTALLCFRALAKSYLWAKAKIEFDSATEHSYSSVWRWFSVFLSLQFHSATEHSYSTALFCYRALVFYCLTLQLSTLEFDSASVRSYSTVWLCYRVLILHSFILPQSTRFPQFDSATTTVARALNFDSATERLCSSVWLCYRALILYSLNLLQSTLFLQFESATEHSFSTVWLCYRVNSFCKLWLIATVSGEYIDNMSPHTDIRKLFSARISLLILPPCDPDDGIGTHCRRMLIVIVNKDHLPACPVNIQQPVLYLQYGQLLVQLNALYLPVSGSRDVTL